MTSTINEAMLFLSRWTELSVTAKATMLLALGLSAAWLCRRSQASLRHLMLATTFATLLVLPALMAAGPRLPLAVSLPQGEAGIAVAAPAPLAATTGPESLGSDLGAARESEHLPVVNWPQMIRFAWLAGGMVLLAHLTVNLWLLRRLRRDGLPWPERRAYMQSLAGERGVRQPVEILLHERIPAPLACGLWHPTILLPADALDWREGELRSALVHELEHVRRGDWAIQLMARAACGCYWFHPMAWMAWRKLCLEAERACDDAVIQSGAQVDYAEQLVSLARRMSKAQTQPALGMANRSDLARRVSAVLDPSQHRGRAGNLAAASAVIAASLAVFAIAPLEAVAQSTAERQTVKPASNGGRAGEALNRALYEAAEAGDSEDIVRLVNSGANVNSKLPGDGSPLIGAARKGRLDSVRVLLDRGADPNMAVGGDGNPLIMAAREGHAEVVTLLLDRGANVNLAVPDDENALIQAAGHGRLDVVKLLVSRGADVNSRIRVEQSGNPNGEWRSPLGMALGGKHQAVADYLISVGARQ